MMSEEPQRKFFFWRASRSGRDDRGSTLVEFAIVVIVFLTIVLGIMDFCRFLYTYHFVSEVAREGTRYAVTRGSTYSTACSSTTTFACYATAGNITTFVESLSPPGIESGSLTVDATWPGALSNATGSCTTTANSTTGVDDNPGCLVEVKVSYPYKFMFVFLPGSATTWTVSSTSEMVIQQ
jgi:Flp pilus assembly protein TadG